MLQLPMHRLAIAIAENTLKGIGVTDAVKRMIGRADSGGVRWHLRDIEWNLKHIRHVSGVVTRHIDVRGKTGVEVGPGDNLAVAYNLLAQGAERMYGVEKFASIKPEWNQKLCAELGGDHASRLHHVQALFEDFRPGVPVHFIYSHDVIEHVDPKSVFHHAFELLEPGGDFVHAVDLTGHGVFHNPKRPLDFLTCPDWLWPAIFSAMETTNRIRWSDLLQLARESGFEIVSAQPVRRVSSEYLSSVRPHLLPRYQALEDEDLSVMQCEVHLRKPN